MDDEVSLVEVFNVKQNVCLIKSFLDKNYPIVLDWDNEDIIFLLLLYTNATVKNEIIGLAAFTPNKKPKYHMNVLYIKQEWRKKKFGTNILKYAKQKFGANNVTFSVMFTDIYLFKFYSKFAVLNSVHLDLNVYKFLM